MKPFWIILFLHLLEANSNIALPSAAQASIILDGCSSSGQQAADRTSRILKSESWQLCEFFSLLRFMEIKVKWEVEPHRKRACRWRVCLFTPPVSFLLWLNKMIITDCLGTPCIPSARLWFWWMLDPFYRTMWGKRETSLKSGWN